MLITGPNLITTLGTEMGGCVSVEALYTKMLAKSAGSFTINKTTVVILGEALPKTGVETIVIPMFEESSLAPPIIATNLAASVVVPAPPIEQNAAKAGGSVVKEPPAAPAPPLGSGGADPTPTKSNSELQQSQNEGPNKIGHRIPYDKLCPPHLLDNFKTKVEQVLSDTVLFQLREKKLSHAECEGVGFNIKNLMFVLVDKSPNFLKDRLPSILQSLYARAELMHFPSLAIPGLHNSSMLGCGDSEVAQATASATVAYLSKPPAIDAKPMARIYLVSTEENYTNELKKAFQAQADLLKSRSTPESGHN